MRTWWVTGLVLACAAPALAQGASVVPSGLAAEVQAEAQPSPGIIERLAVTGSVRAGYWSSTRTLDAEQHLGAAMLWLRTSRRLSSRVSVLAEGWAAFHGPLDDGDAAAELREAFVDLRLGRLDVRAGRQIIAWGRADGLNPTDNLSGQDLTSLVPDDADRRLGATALRARYHVGDVSLTGIWLPELRGHRFAFPAPPPGVSVDRSAGQWPGDQWAVRVEQVGRAVDWSVSYFQGGDTAPDLGAVSREGAPAIRLSHHRVHVVGADMTANLGRFGLRAEGAYVGTEDHDGRDPFIKNPFLFIVAGTDRTFAGRLNLNVQYVFRYVIDADAATATPDRADGFASGVAALQAIINTQTRPIQHGASFRLAHKWRHDTVEAECAVAAYAGPSGAAVRPKVVYAVTDDWKVLLGAEILRGETSSVFGLLRQNSSAYAEVRWGF
jgi:hypothetical protein